MDESPTPVPRWLDVATAWAWRLLVVGAAIVAGGIVVSRLRVVLIPVFVALLLATVLIPVRRAFTRRGVPTTLAMLLTVGTFFGGLALAGFVIVPPLIDEFADLDATLEESLDEIEDWLVDGPLGLDRDVVESGREQLEDGASSIEASDGAIVDGAVLVGEVLAGLVLSLVVAFFIVKDGERIQAVALSLVPDARAARVRRAASAVWRTLGGYLRGAAMLGIIEGIVIGIAMAVVGAELALPVAALTLLAAFFPFVGAIAAGIIAVLVTLVTAGPAEAAVIAVVAIVVQQLDNDLLAPVIYGKALSLHPLVVILTLAVGGVIGGLAGAFVSVPLAAIVLRVIATLREEPAAEVVPAAADDG